jgi:hypothetical protein
MYKNWRGTTTDSWRISALASLVFYATVNALFSIATVAHAEAQDRAAQPSVPRFDRRLCIEWGVTDVQYRRQVLALTPLGSSYDDVRAFILHEWIAEKLSLKSNPKFPPGLTRMGSSEIVLQRHFNQPGMNVFLRNEPPHIKIVDRNNPFLAYEGRPYIQPFFYYKPVWWKRSLYVTVLYVFDAHFRVIDLFAHGGVVMPSP